MKGQLTGVLLQKSEVRKVGASGFEVQDIVVGFSNGDYPQEAKLQCVRGAILQLASIQAGTPVHIEYEIQGRKYARKSDGQNDWFTTLNVLTITPEGTARKPEPSNDEPTQLDVPF